MAGNFWAGTGGQHSHRLRQPRILGHVSFRLPLPWSSNRASGEWVGIEFIIEWSMDLCGRRIASYALSGDPSSSVLGRGPLLNPQFFEE